MSRKADNDAVATVQAQIQDVRDAIERIAQKLDRVDFDNRFAFHNQLDVLSQRNAALAREVKQFKVVNDPDRRSEIRNRVQTELNELQQAVRQVAGRADRKAPETVSSR